MARIERLFETGQPGYLERILSHFCAGELDRDLFRRLLPVYYGAFLDLKRSLQQLAGSGAITLLALHLSELDEGESHERMGGTNGGMLNSDGSFKSTLGVRDLA